MNEDENTVQKYISKFKEEFFQMKFEDVAFPRSVRGLVKYYDRGFIYTKGTPIQVKGSLLYNDFF